jgi:hypothetical protein
MRSYEFVSEKAVSKKQQQFFGIVRAMQKGDMKKGGEAGEVAKDMKVSDVKDFAKTKHKGLPTKKKSEGYADDQKEKTQRQLAAHEKAMIKSAKKSVEKYEKNKKVKGSKTNVLFNLGMTESKDPALHIRQALQLEKRAEAIWQKSVGRQFPWKSTEQKLRQIGMSIQAGHDRKTSFLINDLNKFYNEFISWIQKNKLPNELIRLLKQIQKLLVDNIKNEEAAGVGIVTKQNATADVPVGGEYMNVKKLFPKNKKKKTKEDNVQELVVKQQRPKIDVIYNIADRKDNSPFPLSYKDTGGASSGGMVYITPENAKKFVQFYERRAKDEQQLMLQALKSVSGLKNLFTNIGLEIAKIETTKEENYEREDLPQIKNKHLEHIRHTVETVEIGDIVPVQNEFVFENFKKQVDKISEGSYAPIIVDCNNKIINGHHRYAALQMLGETNVKVAKLFLTVNAVVENFADGKKKGKSRPGRVKKSGASCNGSVTSLRKKSKNAGGEKGRMYHWCANMKSGRKKG